VLNIEILKLAFLPVYLVCCFITIM